MTVMIMMKMMSVMMLIMMIDRMVEEEVEEGDRLALWEKARLLEEEKTRLLEEEEVRLSENRVEDKSSSEGKRHQTVDPSKAAEVPFFVERLAQ